MTTPGCRVLPPAVDGDDSPGRDAAQLAAVIASLPSAVVELDGKGLVRGWNRAAEELLGWSAGEVLGQLPPTMSSRGEADLVSLLDELWSGARSPRTARLRCRRKDRRTIDVEIRLARVSGSGGEDGGAVLVLLDVSEQARLARQLKDHSVRDPLTGLPNRAVFSERLASCLDEAAGRRRTAVLLVSLDRFTEVNDAFGYGYGDQVLAQIGPRLLAAVLRSNDTVARLFGDEFGVILPGLRSVDGAVSVGHRISAALHTPFVVDGVQLDLEASIGIAVAPDHGEEAVRLLRSADRAMLEAKTASSGVVLFEPERFELGQTRLELLGELRKALANEEFVLHYQPKVSVDGQRLHGVEALVRWQHPTRGLLFPGEFLPVAETTGLITQLTLVVLDLALGQARAWSDAGYEVPVAVNLSTRCLHDPSLPTQVATALDRHAVPAQLLRLEITETMLMTDPVRALRVLRVLAESGIRLSVDDFGTGFSSMSYLRHLPVDELKIDRSFVADLAGHAPDQVLTRAAVDLAHNLGLSVVAEGVEDAATLAALQSLGCDVAQGFYLARPQPAEQITEWIADLLGRTRRAPSPMHSSAA